MASPVETVLDWAQAAGLATGLVTNTRVTHATPAALYARTASRDWECDTALPAGCPVHCRDIARQLVEGGRGRGLRVVLGGGRAAFTPTRHLAALPNNITQQWNCSRRDGRDLVRKWKKLHNKGQFVTSESELQNIDFNSTEHILGKMTNQFYLRIHTCYVEVCSAGHTYRTRTS